MEILNIHQNKNKILNENELKIKFDNLKSDYFLKKIFEKIQKRKSLLIINYNKKIQKRLNITIKDYIGYSGIEIEIIPMSNKYGRFINIPKDEGKKYYHIYFNDENEEIKKEFLTKDDKVSKVTLIINYQINSFNRLFYHCQCIKSIYFKRFNSYNIIDMSEMFFGCSSLQELNASNFKTNNVKYMYGMFFHCESLKELDLSKFNTNNVISMFSMFYGCSSLKELNICNFNTHNVTDMSQMFLGCSSLKKIKFSDFNTDKLINNEDMFAGCLEEFEVKFKFLNKINDI